MRFRSNVGDYLSGVSFRMDATAGLEQLNGLTDLQTLDLAGTEVTDAGLTHLKGLTQLVSLDLSGTNITDAGLMNLKGLTRLVTLDLSGTNITDAGARKLDRALPECEIRR